MMDHIRQATLAEYYESEIAATGRELSGRRGYVDGDGKSRPGSIRTIEALGEKSTS
jgi:hypothetical protein